MPTGVEERLASMEGEYEAAEARAGGGTVPDDTYQATIERFDFWEPDGGGELRLVTECLITSGDYAGMHPPSVWHNLEDPEKLGFLKAYLNLLGLGEVKLSELQGALETVLDTPVEIRVATRKSKKDGKEYTNTYINKRLGDPPAPGSGASPQAGSQPSTDNDIPF